VPREVQRERPGGRAVAGSSAIAPPGTNIRVFQRVPEPAIVFTPSSSSSRQPREVGLERATSASSPA
jgi:hypothetical protein